jgi:hypothetical protein
MNCIVFLYASTKNIFSAHVITEKMCFIILIIVRMDKKFFVRISKKKKNQRINVSFDLLASKCHVYIYTRIYCKKYIKQCAYKICGMLSKTCEQENRKKNSSPIIKFLSTNITNQMHRSTWVRIRAEIKLLNGNER